MSGPKDQVPAPELLGVEHQGHAIAIGRSAGYEPDNVLDWHAHANERLEKAMRDVSDRFFVLFARTGLGEDSTLLYEFARVAAETYERATTDLRTALSENDRKRSEQAGE
jgi:hypothetical protein